MRKVARDIMGASAPGFFESRFSATASPASDSAKLAEILRVLQMPVCRLLIGAGKGKHLGFTKKLADKSKACRVPLLIEAVGKNHAWMPRKVGERCV